MKPLVIGMGPTRSHPADAWHPEALSTANLCHLIMGPPARWPTVQSHFEVIDLNKRWYRIEGSPGDSLRTEDAEETLRALTTAGSLRGGRKAFLLGEQVTNFVLAFLQRSDSLLATDAWRKLPKCVGRRLRAGDPDASIGRVQGYYDFIAIPLWHPRILTTQEIRMPPGWQQRMMNALRAAAELKSMRFKPMQRPAPADCGKRDPVDQRSPIG